jgi:hypothetical protein
MSPQIRDALLHKLNIFTEFRNYYMNNGRLKPLMDDEWISDLRCMLPLSNSPYLPSPSRSLPPSPLVHGLHGVDFTDILRILICASENEVAEEREKAAFTLSTTGDSEDDGAEADGKGKEKESQTVSNPSVGYADTRSLYAFEGPLLPPLEPLVWEKCFHLFVNAPPN